MDDELPEQLRSLRKQYDGLRYPGDLASDLGLVPARPIAKPHGGWRIGWTIVRWAGVTAAAAAIVLAVSGVWRGVALNHSSVAQNNINPVPATQPERVANAGVPNSDHVVSSPKLASPSSDTAVARATPKANAAATDDSIPMWSDIDFNAADTSASAGTQKNSDSTVAAGLPAGSLIMPTWSELQAETSPAKQASAAAAKS